MAKSECVIFGGVAFYRYPEAAQKHRRNYFFSRNSESLHQAIWKKHHGAIPPGLEIHHKDENPLNNDISNLACITVGEHRRIHGANGATPAMRKNLERIRPLTKRW